MRTWLVAGLLLAQVVLAPTAQAVSPQPGVWLIDEENNGRPGRGFQLDHQVGTVVLTYYGYRADGSATYLLGAGQIAKDTVVIELVEYAGGQVLGGPNKDARAVSSKGNATITFTSNTSGRIQLPGETSKTISRGTFADPTSRLTVVAGYTYQDRSTAGADPTVFNFSFAGGKFTLDRNSQFTGQCRFTGDIVPTGDAVASSGRYDCSDFTSGSYQARDLRVDDNGFYTGTIARKLDASNVTFVESHVGVK